MVDAVMERLNALGGTPAVANTQVTFSLSSNRPPMLPSLAARKMAAIAVAAGAKIGYPITVLDTPFGGGCDAAYAAGSGKAGVVESFGPSGEGAHSLGAEFIDLDSLQPCIYVMARTIVQLSQVA